MTKQKIIEIANKNLGYNYNNGVIPYITDKGAEKLLDEFEKEKKKALEFAEAIADKRQEFALKEQAREIFTKIYNELEYDSLGQFAIIKLAKEYGVKL